MVILTDHAIDRAKQRLGLSKSAIARSAAKALQKGINRIKTVGSLRRYLDGQWHLYDEHLDIIVWGEHLYIFDSTVLITMYCLPTKYKRAARKNAGRPK